MDISTLLGNNDHVETFFQDFNDTTSGLSSLIQSVINALFSKDIGNLLQLKKQRVTEIDVNYIVNSSIEKTINFFIEEQSEGIFPDNESLEDIKIQSIDVKDDSLTIALKIIAVNGESGEINV